MHTLKKEYINLISRIVKRKTDKLSIQYKDNRCQNVLSPERQDIIKCILSRKLEKVTMW